MKIVGFQGVSLIDFPGHISTVLFSPGCNFVCPYCQNPDLVDPDKSPQPAPEEEIEQLLLSRKGFIDGVTLSGGEPTIHADLPDFLRWIKGIGLPVKLDTNGYRPSVLQQLIDEDLVAFVAMDIKASPDRYAEAVGRKIDMNRINQSIRILMDSSVDYEFRTTVAPTFVDEQDIREIGQWIAGAKAYRLQQYSNKTTLDPSLTSVKPLPPDHLRKMLQIAQQTLSDVKLRGV